VNAAVYLTIWSALALFAAGIVGRARLGDRASSRAWPWQVWIAGLCLCAIHFALAFAVVHGWSHAAAERATAAQTKAVFGLDWGGGVYVNYLFLAVWALDAWMWRRGVVLPRGLAIAIRAFYLIVVLNAAVIFAAGWRRVLGGLIAMLIVVPRSKTGADARS
jgi:hypothetical protein